MKVQSLSTQSDGDYKSGGDFWSRQNITGDSQQPIEIAGWLVFVVGLGFVTQNLTWSRSD